MLEAKVAIITGASRGIGRATALSLAKNGAKVVVNYLHHGDSARATVEQIQKANGSAIMVRADVTDMEQVSQMTETALSTYDRLDILVNNAGAIIRPAGWQDITEDIWDRSFDVNLKGAFHCIRASVDYLSNSDSATIINVTSTFGATIGAPGVIAYAAAKAGILSLTRAFAKALGPRIRVNCVAPGIIDTDMTSKSPPNFVKEQVNNTPLNRIGAPADVADVILFLASPLSRFVTGQMIVVDGGHSLK